MIFLPDELLYQILDNLADLEGVSHVCMRFQQISWRLRKKRVRALLNYHLQKRPSAEWHEFDDSVSLKMPYYGSVLFAYLEIDHGRTHLEICKSKVTEENSGVYRMIWYSYLTIQGDWHTEAYTWNGHIPARRRLKEGFHLRASSCSTDKNIQN